MGIYWKWICEEAQEQLSPDALEESVKCPWYGEKTRLAFQYATSRGRWYGKAIKLINDAGDQDLFYDTDEWLDIATESYEAAEKEGFTNEDRP